MIFVLLLVGLALGAQQARDLQRPAAGTLALSGTVVTDDDSATPIRGVDVRMHVASDPLTMRSTTTDGAGRFRFTQLAPGNVTLTVSKPGYVTTTFGAKRPGTTVGVPIALVEGKSIEPVRVRMPRGAVITGTILDQSGRPIRGAPVRLQRVTTTARGQRVVTPFSPVSPAQSSSDDRGIYRIYGLPAGDYLVFVQPRLPGPLLTLVDGRSELTGNDVRQTTAEELQWAERAIATARGGLVPAGAAPQAMQPPAPKTVTYADVFHPGTPDPSAAAVVSVRAGQERTGIDIPVQFVATATIAGVVRDANGQPPKGLSVTLLPKGPAASQELERELVLMNVGLISGRGVTRTNADGTFTIRAVPPGAYTVIARTGIAPPTAAAVAVPGAPAQWAAADVSVDGHDVDGVTLTLTDALKVEGRVTFESATGAAPPRATLRLAPAGPGVFPGTSVTVDPATGLFSIGGVLPGEYRLTTAVSPPGRVSPWTLVSAMLDGRDVVDVPFTVVPGQNVTGVRVTFTDAAAELAGTLFDSAGRPTSDLSIMLLAVDPARWFRGSRHVRAPVRPSSGGRFTFSGLVAGEYYLAALSDFEPSDLIDPAFLEEVAAGAIRVVIASGEKKVQDVRIR